MIASCPQCSSRYRIAREKIGPSGARIRCSRCETIFRVEPPGPRPGDAAIPQAVVEPAPVPSMPEPPMPEPDPAVTRPPAPMAMPQPVPAPQAAAVQAAPAAPQATEIPVVRARALVAEADPEIAKSIAGFLESWSIDVDVVHAGGDALLRLFRQKPDFAVLGGHLPGVGSPVLTEVLRRTTERRDLALIRIAPMDEPAGAPEFDANETLEPGDLPEGLAAILGRLGFGTRPEPQPALVPPPAAPVVAPPEPVAAPMPAEFSAPTPEPVAAPPAPAAVAPETQAAPAAAAPAEAPAATPRRRRRPPLSDDPEIAAAERLARIAVSDVILYNEEKFAQAVATGDVASAMAGDIEEARNHFNQRIPEAVRSQRDFLIEELERRAAALNQ